MITLQTYDTNSMKWCYINAKDAKMFNAKIAKWMLKFLRGPLIAKREGVYKISKTRGKVARIDGVDLVWRNKRSRLKKLERSWE